MTNIHLDLAKHGLARLKDTPPHEWSAADLERLMAAYATENIAPVLSGAMFTPRLVRTLLAASHCRQCGRCCQPNPETPETKGVLVTEEDLAAIGRQTGRSLAELKQLTIPHDRAENGCFLPLPCPFHSAGGPIRQDQGKCLVYEARPLVCRTYPVTNTPQGGVAVNVACEYGKDIYRAVLQVAKRRASGG